MRVADVMSSKPVAIAPNAPVSEAFRVASAYGVHDLVVTEGQLPVGVVCVAFCVDFWDRAGPPRVGDDLGVSD